MIPSRYHRELVALRFNKSRPPNSLPPPNYHPLLYSFPWLPLLYAHHLTQHRRGYYYCYQYVWLYRTTCSPTKASS